MKSFLKKDNSKQMGQQHSQDKNIVRCPSTVALGQGSTKTYCYVDKILK
jgi:hypothetical protein